MSRELNADGHGTDALLMVHLRLQVSRWEEDTCKTGDIVLQSSGEWWPEESVLSYSTLPHRFERTSFALLQVLLIQFILLSVHPRDRPL